MYYGMNGKLVGIGSIYDPRTYPEGVPNPFVPRVHAWGGGPWPTEGTRYHGPVYTRPMFAKPWDARPLMGLGAEPDFETVMLFEIGGAVVGALAGGVIGAQFGEVLGPKAEGALIGCLLLAAAGRAAGRALGT